MVLLVGCNANRKNNVNVQKQLNELECLEEKINNLVKKQELTEIKEKYGDNVTGYEVYTTTRIVQWSWSDSKHIEDYEVEGDNVVVEWDYYNDTGLIKITTYPNWHGLLSDGISKAMQCDAEFAQNFSRFLTKIEGRSK